MLLYANRAAGPGLQFRVHGQLTVSDLQVRRKKLEMKKKYLIFCPWQVVDSEPRMGADFCFNIYDGKRALMVAAATQAEKTQWMDDITETVQVRMELIVYLVSIFIVSMLLCSNIWIISVLGNNFNFD